MEINLTYKEMTDEKSYKNIKKLYKLYPEVVMKPKEWKKLRIIELKRLGKNWSK